MDRHWNTSVKRSKALRSVNSNHSNIATWSISSSRERRSDPLQWRHWRIQEEEVRWCFAITTWRLDINTGNRRRAKKIFHYCVNPNSSNQFLYLRSIQGHSGNNAVDLALQDSVLLPNDFVEYIHHIGNAHDMHSIIQGGLIRGGRSLKRDRQSVFFTALKPIYANQDLEEIQYDLD